MITQADKAFYAAKVQEALNTLNARFSTSVNMPRIVWGLRGKSRLGMATGWTTIHLNIQYAAALGREKYTQTVLHETCHIFTTWRREFFYGEPHQKHGPWSSHGTEWQLAMRVLGRKPERCSSNSAEVAHLIKPARTVKRVPAICGCETHLEITVNMANKIKRGAEYRHRLCGKNLVVR